MTGAKGMASSVQGQDPRRGNSPFPLAVLLAVSALAATGCSVQKFAVGSVANSLTTGPDVFASDDDPELIRQALPFGLKLTESLLAVVPEHQGLLVTSCRGYTQYAYAFLQIDADEVEPTDRARANELRERALHLYLRARGFGLRALELKHRGITGRLETEPDQAVAKLKRRDMPALFWTAAAWGSAISLGRDHPELMADISGVRALMRRALEIDESYEHGAVHEAMIPIEGLPEVMGGSAERARSHFRRAVELSEGTRPAPYVLLAESVSIPKQNRAEFDSLLKAALEIDPERNPESRLETLLLQRKARDLLARGEQLFLEPDTTHDEETR
jgi:predicted anti-sigma-YlaC factor YlaD